MTDRLNDRDVLFRTFMDVLKETFNLYKQGRIGEIDLIGRLSENNTIFWDYCKIGDKQLNAAISFCDSFFDAVWHGVSDVNGISMDEAERLVTSIVDVLSRGDKIEDERILSYSCKGRHRWAARGRS